MTHGIRVPCTVCDALCEIVDERGMTVVCHGCMGHGWKLEEPAGPACELVDLDALRAGMTEGFDETADG